MRMAAVLMAVLLLAGCAKKAPPMPPGPASDVTYPRTYPLPTPTLYPTR